MYLKDIALVLLGAVLTFIGERILYRWQKRDERQEGPHIVVAKIVKDDQMLLDIRNVGTDSLSEMEVALAWNQKGQPQKRALEHFISPEQPVHTASQSHIEVLGPTERYTVLDLPQSADDGIVTVTVTGVGVRSKKLYKAYSEVAVGLSPQQ